MIKKKLGFYVSLYFIFLMLQFYCNLHTMEKGENTAPSSR